MNEKKIRSIVELIRGQGKLPTDEFGQVLAVDELVGWFGLDECLSGEEMCWLKAELAALAEIQRALDELRISQQLRCEG